VIGAILWLHENLAGLLLTEPRCLGKEECTDERNQLTSGDGTFRTWGDVRLQSVMRTNADVHFKFILLGVVRKLLHATKESKTYKVYFEIGRRGICCRQGPS
jgi:hypothetical protein